jgi:hypothetical protein
MHTGQVRAAEKRDGGADEFFEWGSERTHASGEMRTRQAGGWCSTVGLGPSPPPSRHCGARRPRDMGLIRDPEHNRRHLGPRNADRPHRGAEERRRESYELLPWSCSPGRRCSTPSGITARWTRSRPSRSPSTRCAQRLPASRHGGPNEVEANELGRGGAQRLPASRQGGQDRGSKKKLTEAGFPRNSRSEELAEARANKNFAFASLRKLGSCEIHAPRSLPKLGPTRISPSRVSESSVLAKFTQRGACRSSLPKNPRGRGASGSSVDPTARRRAIVDAR